MKIIGKRSKGIAKGVPSGFLISLIIHAIAFLLAGLLVVFTVHQKEEKKFVPPKPISRPKMKLKKPKVKVKKTAKPKATSRIVTKVKRAGMPDIQLPEMSGMTDSLSDEISGFDILPDMDELTLMGSESSIGSDLKGTFYDLNRSSKGHPTGIEATLWRDNFRKFLTSGWKARTLAKYYRYPKNLYATSLVFPPAPSSIAPSAFGDRDASGAFWMVHYKGQIVHREGITFRFWVNSDENMAIKVNGNIVVACTWRNESGEPDTDPNPVGGLWETSQIKKSNKYFMGNNKAVIGDWITLEPGVAMDMEMVIGDNGGQACFIVAVEEEGMEYPENSQGGPLLPAFKTAEFSRDMLDLIYKNLVDDEITLTSGPVFNDYGSSKITDPITNNHEKAKPVVEHNIKNPEDKFRLWNLTGGKSFEARLITRIGDQVVIENEKRNQAKIPLEQLSAEDLRFVELSRPPKLSIDLIKDIKQKNFVMEHISTNFDIRPPERRAHFGVRVKQTSSGYYNHELFVEYFVLGQERLGQKYILLDRQMTSFIPTKENGRMHESHSEREVVLENFIVDSEPRGETYATYLITVTDKRGKIIGVSAPSSWLYENLDNLKKLRPGNFMDKKCKRVFPTRPPRSRY